MSTRKRRVVSDSKPVAKISRKRLKEDRFRKEVGHSVEYVASHRNQFIVWGTIVIVLLVVSFGYQQHERSRSIAARHELHEAINMFHGRVDTEERIGEITFPTSITKYNQTTEALEKIIADFSDRTEGQAARYYLSLLEIQQEKHAEARERLDSLVADQPEGEIGALARLALADLYARDAQDDKARAHYEHLIAQPTRLVPKERSQLAFGRYLVEKSPEEATEVLNELTSQPGPWAVAAGSALRSIDGS